MKKIILAIFACSTLLFGSATIFSGNNQSISIDSEPAGAKVYVDGQLRGTTPMSIMMDKSITSHEIRVQKNGYVDVNVPMKKQFDPVAILNVFWDFSTTDVLTGSVMQYSPNNYYFTLEKK